MTTIPDTATTVVRASHVPGPPQGQWTYADYVQVAAGDGFEYEVIEGVLYMTPAPTPEHERITMVIGARLVAVVEDTGAGQVFGSPDIDVGFTTIRPDVVVVLNEHLDVVADKRLVGAPDLVVEIASPSTAAYDRDQREGKWAAYQRIGVPEYWIIDPAARSIEVLALVDGQYQPLGSVSGDEQVPSRIIPGLALAARRFFTR